MNQRIYYLDGLRGLLALSVVVSHIIGGITAWSATRLFIGAYLAVDIFFILSGFVLARLLYQRNYTHISFFWMRFFRLWPLHVSVIIFCIIVYEFNRYMGRYAPPGSFKDVSLFLKNSFFLMTMGIEKIPVINPPSWSIGIEFWTSAVLLPMLVRIRPSALYALSVVCYAFIAYNVKGLAPAYTIYSFVSLGLVKGIAGMTLGIAIYKTQKEVYEILRKIDLEWLAALFVFSISYIFVAIIWQKHSPLNFIVIALTIPILNVETFGKVNFVYKLFSSKPLVWLGKISFSLYLIHTPILVLLGVPNIAKRVGDVNAAIFVAMICVGAAALVHYYFEAPVAKAVKRHVNLGSRGSVREGT